MSTTPQDPRDPSLGEARDRLRHARVSTDEANVAKMSALVADERCGAIVTFDGVVRNHDEGRGVLTLDYEAHPSASDVMEEVCLEIVERFPDVIVAAEHAYGSLAIGDSALAVAVAAPHRGRAFEACDALVNEVKARVPIWKNQTFTDGSSEWVGALG